MFRWIIQEDIRVSQFRWSIGYTWKRVTIRHPGNTIKTHSQTPWSKRSWVARGKVWFMQCNIDIKVLGFLYTTVMYANNYALSAGMIICPVPFTLINISITWRCHVRVATPIALRVSQKLANHWRLPPLLSHLRRRCRLLLTRLLRIWCTYVQSMW